MNLIPAPPTTPVSVNCSSILTHDFAKVSTVAKVQSPLLRTECSLLSAGGGAQSLPLYLQTASVQQRHRQWGCNSHLLWGTSPSPGEISKEEKPILPIHPHLKQAPAKPHISKLLSHKRHHHYYRKQHPKAAVLTSHNKSTSGTVYFNLLPQEATKMIVWGGHGSSVPVQDHHVLHSMPLSFPMHSMGKHTQPAAWGHETLPKHHSRDGQLQGQPIWQGKLYAGLSPAD